MSTNQTNKDLLAHAVPVLLSAVNRISRWALNEITKQSVEDVTSTISEHLAPIVIEMRAGNKSIRAELDAMVGEYIRRGMTQERMCLQPQGYAGDYLTLDWLYQQPYEGTRTYDVWNRFCYCQQASRAVRFRIEIVRRLIASIVSNGRTEKRFLDIASGPGRIERGVIDAMRPPKHLVHFDLVDADADAVEYSRALLSDDVPENISISVFHKNAFRFEATDDYDAIWSCGLFDYLEDKLAIRLLSKMYSWLKPDGTMLVGNFAKDCQTQWIMEGFYGWVLIYRTEEECMRICALANIPAHELTLERDETGSVILMKIHKGGVL